MSRIRSAITRSARRSEYGAHARAHHLGMSLRVLRRTVAARDTTVREPLEPAHEAHVHPRRHDLRLSIDPVSSRLGNSERHAFGRALERGTATTSAQRRRSARRTR